MALLCRRSSPWLGSRGLQMCDITVSNLGLEGEDGTLMLFDLAGWSITELQRGAEGVALWVTCSPDAPRCCQ